MLLTAFFSWLNAQPPSPSANAAKPTPQIAATEIQDYSLHLGGTSFDPLSQSPQLPDPWRREPAPGFDLYLVQLKGPIQPQWLEKLQKNGLEIVQYLHPYTYVVWTQSSVSLALANHDFVRWSGFFETGYRVLPHFRGLDSADQDIRLLAYQAVNPAHMANSLSNLGAKKVQWHRLGKRFWSFTMTLPGTQFDQAASIAGVYTLQAKPKDGGTRGEMSNQIIAGNFDMSNILMTGYTAWLDGLGLNGNGVTMANVDLGVDQDHMDLANNILPCTGETCAQDLQSNHGTHTAGIMAADGSSGELDGSGFLRGLGVAPGAKLVEQYYFNNFSGPEGMLKLIRESQENGAILSSNSWGPSGSPRGYDIATMEVDIGVRDANETIPGNQSFSYILAIDNGNGGTQTQGTPDEGKNLFAIGSTWAQNQSGPQRLDFNSVSNNSAHGPALDGRFLPQMVAPGKWVDSTYPGDHHQTNTGTSMAAPHVAGAVALFVEKYRASAFAQGGPDPSPALIKAAFLPVAIDLEGNTDADGVLLGHRFDAKQGWGRMDLRAVLDPDTPVMYFDNPRVLEITGDQWRANLQVADPAHPLKMMLVWTDAPGHGLGGATPAWNNDLDLKVTYNASTYSGNLLGMDGWSTPGTVTEIRNNSEGVLIGPTATGDFKITVSGSNLSSDGIPGNNSPTDQDFAIVCYNCQQTPDFALNMTTRYLFLCSSNQEILSVDVGSLSGFGDQVTLSLMNLPPEISAGFDNNPVSPPASTNLTLDNLNDLDPGLYTFQVLAQSGSLSDSLSVILNVNSAAPGQTPLSSPLNFAVGQTLTPEFIWGSVNTANNYTFILASDDQFQDIVYTDVLEGTFLPLPVQLNYGSTYYWRVTAANNCGDGPPSPIFRFSTQAPPPILLIDDDDNDPNVQSHYTNTLDYWGVTYDLWDTNNSLAEPTLTDMNVYDLIIWFSGDAGDSENPKGGPSTDAETALSSYLDLGKHLIISSQHYFDDRNEDGGPNSFMTSYLGLESALAETNYTQVTGSGPGFEGLGPFDLSPPYVHRPTALTPSVDGTVIFQSDPAQGAIRYSNDPFTTFYLGFGFEGLNEDEKLDTMFALLTESNIVVNDMCRNELNFNGKLTFWPQLNSVVDLINCLNAFR